MERKSLGELFSFDITPYASPVRYPSGAVIFPEWQMPPSCCTWRREKPGVP